MSKPLDMSKSNSEFWSRCTHNRSEFEALVLGYAAGKGLKVVCTPDGHSVFPLYADDGLPSARLILYFRVPNIKLVDPPVDFGVEGKHHASVWPVELRCEAILKEALKHLEQRAKKLLDKTFSKG